MNRLPLKAFLIVMIFVIIGVSAYDNYLLIKHQSVMAEVEKNPMGRFLIALNDNKVSLFSAVKLFGTATASMFLVLMFEKFPIKTLIIAAVCMIFQIVLFWYLLNF